MENVMSQAVMENVESQAEIVMVEHVVAFQHH